MVTEADINGQRRINYEEFYKIMMGPGKGISKQEKEKKKNPKPPINFR